jgi:GrpB-like predicted nucleotidyltransferase (UPF0157 family)
MPIHPPGIGHLPCSHDPTCLPDTDTNSHVFTAGTDEVDRMLCFHDRLRTDAGDGPSGTR